MSLNLPAFALTGLTHGYSESTGVPIPELIGTLVNPVGMALQENQDEVYNS